MLKSYLKKDHVILDLKAKDKVGVLKEMVDVLDITPEAKELVVNALLQREKIGSTGVGKGIALPHCRTVALDRTVVVVAISKEGVDFDSLDGKPVHYLFMVVASPIDPSMKYLTILGALARLSRAITSEPELRLDFKDEQELIDYLIQMWEAGPKEEME